MTVLFELVTTLLKYLSILFFLNSLSKETTLIVSMIATPLVRMAIAILHHDRHL